MRTPHPTKHTDTHKPKQPIQSKSYGAREGPEQPDSRVQGPCICPPVCARSHGGRRSQIWLLHPLTGPSLNGVWPKAPPDRPSQSPSSAEGKPHLAAQRVKRNGAAQPPRSEAVLLMRSAARCERPAVDDGDRDGRPGAAGPVRPGDSKSQRRPEPETEAAAQNPEPRAHRRPQSKNQRQTRTPGAEVTRPPTKVRPMSPLLDDLLTPAANRGGLGAWLRALAGVC